MRFDFDANRGHIDVCRVRHASVSAGFALLFGQLPGGKGDRDRSPAGRFAPCSQCGRHRLAQVACSWPAASSMHCPPSVPVTSTIIRIRSGKPFRDALVRTAMARTRTDGAAALWELDLGGRRGHRDRNRRDGFSFPFASSAAVRQRSAPGEASRSDAQREHQRACRSSGRDDRPRARSRHRRVVARQHSPRPRPWNGCEPLCSGRAAMRCCSSASRRSRWSSVRVGALHGWRRGVTAGLGLIAPSWPFVALAWSASTTLGDAHRAGGGSCCWPEASRCRWSGSACVICCEGWNSRLSRERRWGRAGGVGLGSVAPDMPLP